MIMIKWIKKIWRRIFTQSHCTCKDCKNKVQVGTESYLCLMNNGIVHNYGKYCKEYSK